MLQTPLIEFHRSQGAKLVDFAGWEMPVVYRGIIEEHLHTRQHASLFDVSHMGRIDFTGPDAGAFLERLCTRRLEDAKVGQCRYSHVCREDGGILDDVIVSRYPDRWFMVCNASNREKLLGWFERQRGAARVEWRDRTTDTAMIAIQGPEAMETLRRLMPISIDDIKRYHFKHDRSLGMEYYLARSGYTGEDGLEVIIPTSMATTAAQMLMSQSEEMGRPVLPAGLGARDTLRLEAAMPLYGHELTEEWDSLTAGQAWCVDLTKPFIGRDAMQRVKDAGATRQIVGFGLEGKRIARQGAEVFAGDRRVGVVTSGTHSPTFDRVIGMALLESAHAATGTRLEIDLRGTRAAATVEALPFYKRPK